MKIIIVGCGRVGQTLAEKLNADGNDVTVIDMDAAKVKAVASRFDVMGVVGNGATYTAQREAGVEDADLFIAVTNSDELNLFCCTIAKKESNCQTVARVKNPEYSMEMEYLKDTLGLVMVINPEYAAAEEIARVLRFPSALKIEPFAGGRVELIKFKLQKDGQLAGLSIREAMAKFRVNVLVCAIERGEEAYIAKGDFVFQEKDIVTIVASPKNANDFFKTIRYKGHNIKNVLVVGGGVVTHYLCDILEKSGIGITVVEKDLKICEEMAAKWDKINVIHGDTNDREFLLEEGVESTDAFVALSHYDEENIVLSLFAKEVGVKKLVTRINRTDYDDVIKRLDLDTVICPRNITSDNILRYVRATKNAQGSDIETLYNIIPDRLEATEFIVKEGSPVIGKPLMELKFKQDILIASILRGETVTVPRGHDTIEAGDSVIVISRRGVLSDIADALE